MSRSKLGPFLFSTIHEKNNVCDGVNIPCESDNNKCKEFATTGILQLGDRKSVV